MGITDSYDVSVNREVYDRDNAAYIVTFKNKVSGKEYGALLDQHFEAGKKFFTANTLDLGKGGLGAAFYQMASEFAARRNIPIFPESSLSGINTYRRTEQQLSAALRTGKSNVMTPHPTQRVYGFVDDAKTVEQHEANLARLILATVRNARELVPGFDKLRYHPETGAFTDVKGKSQEAKLKKLLATDDARAFGLGRSTLARALLTQQMLDGNKVEAKSFKEPILYSARDTAALEYQAVIDQYQGTDGWMKAPNGQPTKLTERQWVQVRTPSFAAWFGPWQEYGFNTPNGTVWADAENKVSKAVDENGEPLVVYHGTDKGGFMEFNRPGGEKRGDLGIFTTPNRDMARSYVRRAREQDMTPPTDDEVLNEIGIEVHAYQGRTSSKDTEDRALYGYTTPDGDEVSGFLTKEEAVKSAIDDFGDVEFEQKSGVYAVFMNIRNPNEDDFDGALWSGSREHLWKVVDGGGDPVEFNGKIYMEEDEARALAKTLAAPEDEFEGADYLQPADDHWNDTDGVVKESIKLKNDGAIIRNVVDDGGGYSNYNNEPSDVFVALKPKQIKSADFNTGEFGLSRDLRHSKRVGDFKYEIDERGRIVVEGDVDRIIYLVKQHKDIGNLTSTENTVRLQPKDTFAVLEALENAPKVDPKIAKRIAKRLRLTKQEIDSTSLGMQTGELKNRAFVSPLVDGIPAAVRALEGRRLATGLPALDLDNAADRTTLARLIAAETLAAIDANEGTSEWYDQTIGRTMAMAAVKYPELATAPHARMAFRLAMAISSQTMDVEANLNFAMEQYEGFRKSSDTIEDMRFPEVGAGKSGDVMKKNFMLANKLWQEMGPDLLGKFLQTEFTVAELNAAGLAVDGELVEESVLGSSVFGPKIGFGFYSNLSGNFEPITMDMWFMRLIGRLRGKLRSFNPEKFDGQLERFRKSLSETGSDGIYADQFDADLVRLAATDTEAAITLARLVSSAHGRDYKKNRDAFDNDIRKKSNLVLSADTMITSLDSPKDAPANGGERQALRDVTRQAVALVQQAHGERIPPAAMQALIWYPEQELYQAHGVKLKVTSQDYAGATEKLLLKEGFDGQELKSASANGARFARPGNGKNDAGTGGRNGQELGQPGALTAAERDQFLGSRIDRQQLEKDKLNPKNHRVIFEVAPDPDDIALKAQWDSLSPAEQLRISEKVARDVIPQYLKSIDAAGIILSQDGSFYDDTSPSFVLVLTKGDAPTIAKGLGYGLSQNMMVVLSPRNFKGASKAEAINISIGKKTIQEVDAIYQKLREIEVNGKKVLMGQSTANGMMTIVNDQASAAQNDITFVPTSTLMSLLDGKLDGFYNIQKHDVFTAFPEKKDYDYDNSSQRNPRGNGGLAGQRARDLRTAAASALARELSGIQRSAREGGPGSRRRPSDAATVRQAIHFGQRPGLSQLSGLSNGTGIRGAEDQRLKEATDPRIKRRVYFYSPVQGGIPQPETGLGGNVYQADLDNLYNPSTATRPLSGSGNAFESDVLDAGYDGYLDPTTGVIVMLGQDVPVKQIGNVSDFKQIPRTARQVVMPTQTTVSGGDLVRKPEGQELMALVRNKAALVKAAPSFKMEYGFARVAKSQAADFDQTMADLGSTFRFTEKPEPIAAPDVLPKGKMKVEQTIAQRVATMRELLDCLS